MATKKLKKKQKLRNNEYYKIQDVFDNIYASSKKGKKFTNLLEIITSKENILLAYRNIKKNKGSKTSGTNKINIIEIGEIEPEKLILYVRKRLENFQPQSVKRVEIEKDNGKLRPLGIPTIQDRIIQQCIKQVMEPICEAKFCKYSFGFRPNRSTHHAIARAMHVANTTGLQYVIDIDIKGFFDNVNHAKLLKQIWSLGICDKNLISIISKMLKAEIKGIGIPNKGVPQGGILSPLLSNIVLNELDWWISSQWETHPTHHTYCRQDVVNAIKKKTNLKEVYIVRYADDFKLFCRNRESANRLFIATKNWLKERLGLEISMEKSKIINLKRRYSIFLGVKIKLWKKKNKYVVKSHMNEKAIKKCKVLLKKKIKLLQKETTVANVQTLNATILGIHNYYQVATNVNLDFNKIAFDVNKNLKSRLKTIKSKKGKKSKAYLKFYSEYGGKTIYVHGIAIYPIVAVRTKAPMCYSQDMCNYTVEGRKKIHDKLKSMDNKILKYLLENPVKGMSAEFNDNRISLYVGQNGKCFVTGEKLELSNMEVHHKKQKASEGNDKYGNLVFVKYEVHKLIHATQQQTIDKYVNQISLNTIAYKKINKLRALVGNCEIVKNK